MTNRRKPRLILGKIPDDFDLTIDIPAGPWCFLDRPLQFDQWSTYPFVSDLRADAPNGDSSAFFASCLSYRDRLFPVLKERLDRENGVNFSNEYWHEMIDHWLIVFLQILLVAQHSSQRLIDNYGDRELDLELLDHIKWHYRDTEHFINGAFNNLAFFIWAISKFIRIALPKKWRVDSYTEGNSYSRHDTTTGDGGGWKRRARFLRHKLVFGHISPRCLGVYGLSGWRAIAISILLSLKPKVISSALPQISTSPALPVAGLSSVPFFELLGIDEMAALAWEVIPVSFRSISALPILAQNIVPGKLRIVGNMVVVSDAMKKTIAQAREKGEFIIGSQHGAFGDLTLPPTAITEFGLDGYVTWGWRTHSHYACRYLPLPSPYLQKIKYRKASEDLLFVGLFIALFYPRVCGVYGTNAVLSYVRNKVRFLESIEASILKCVLYRPHTYRHSMDEMPYLRARFPLIRQLDCRPEVRLAGCRLAVIDNPSTAFCQSLAANVPTVAYWNRSLYQMHPRAEEHYEELRRVGIVFDDPVAAANKVNAIWEAIPEWWAQPEIQAARIKWCNEYAHTESAWLQAWAHSLWNLWRSPC